MKSIKRLTAIMILATVATMGTPQAFAGIMLGDRPSARTTQRTGIMLGDVVHFVRHLTGIMLGD
jgi:hypothetical protein